MTVNHLGRMELDETGRVMLNYGTCDAGFMQDCMLVTGSARRF